MSKIIFLGDIHIGARTASPIIADFQIRFFEEVLFPYMLENNITKILQFGDMFDSRKFSNHVILYKWKTRVFDYMRDNNINIISILGNHDIAARNSLEVNAPELFLKEYNNIKIINEVTESKIGDINFLLVPWICSENREKVAEFIKNTDCIYCAGHFEFDGFEMHKGQKSVGGDSIKGYNKFDSVFSGHYHTRSKSGNIQYLGTPFEMSWIDYGDKKGFHVFDCKNHKIKFIENPLTLFNRIEYDDRDKEPNYIISSLKDTYVKIVVINKTNPSKFEKVVNRILMIGPADLKITDIEIGFDDVEVDDTIDISDTKTLMESFVTQIECDLKKDKLNDILNGLYIKALEVVD